MAPRSWPIMHPESTSTTIDRQKAENGRQDPEIIEMLSIYRIQVEENRCLEDETRGGMVASVTYPRVSRLSSRSSFAGY
jgi:hypothetical protein